MANAPHVLFLLPIIRVLASERHELLITLRDFNQTVELAERNGIRGTVIGEHGGRGRLGKLLNLMCRAIHLAQFAGHKGIHIAVSHNSYAQIVAGRLTGLRVVTLMDYEGQPANHLAFRAAHKIIVPDSFPDRALKKFGVLFRRVYKYRGFKEQVYLSDFTPNESFYDELMSARGVNVDCDISKKILVTVRTPATMACYHRFDNPLFEILLNKLNRMTELAVIALPRTATQREEIKAKFPNINVPEYPLDGRNLVYYSDLVISAGGTMNREAAILGTPAYTAFAGSIPSVDKRLIEMGRMTELSAESDLERIEFQKKESRGIMRNPDLCHEIISQIVA